MAFTTTTLSSAMTATQTTATVTSATGFAAGYILRCDGEFMPVAQSYVSGTTIPVLRGRDGTAGQAHAKGANITSGLASDYALPPFAIPDTVVDPAAPVFPIFSYSASGAIPPVQGIHILNGTSVLVMTIAVPTKDQDGQMMYIIGNGAAAHTVQFTGGLSGAGSSYDVITTNATAPIALFAIACNGLWLTLVTAAMTGTVTNITGGVA
jgi:hypothetical protein